MAIKSKIPGSSYSVNTGVSEISVSSSKPLLSIRTKTTAKQGWVIPLNIIVLAESNNILVEVYKNTTLGGTPSWSDVATGSFSEYDMSASSTTGGIKVASFYIAAGPSANTGNTFNITKPIRYPLKYENSVQDTLTITATSTNGTASVYASIIWQEID